MTDFEIVDVDASLDDDKYPMNLPPDTIDDEELGLIFSRTNRAVLEGTVNPEARKTARFEDVWHGGGYFYDAVFEGWDMPDGKSFGLNFTMWQNSCCQKSRHVSVDTSVKVIFYARTGAALHEAFIGNTYRSCNDTPREWLDGLHPVPHLPFSNLIDKTHAVRLVYTCARRVGWCRGCHVEWPRK